MDPIEFKSEYMAEWKPTPYGEYFLRLVAEYHERAEEYDRTVCTDTRHGSAYPATGEQRKLINRNARELRATLLERACRELQIGIADASASFALAFSETSRSRRL